MLKLVTSYSLSQVPYITYDALEEYAEALVRKYAPRLLKTPGAVYVDEFLEYYLRLTVDYHRICYNRKILGITAFNDGMIDVIDEDTGLPKQIPVKAGTVIIDTSLNTKKNEPRLALREVFKEYFRFYGDKPRRIIRGVSPRDNCYAKQLPEYTAKIFNVSYKATLIRLEKLTAIVNKKWGYSL